MKVAIEHIVTFIKVVEHQSFTAAAEQMQVSKSVVSKHVTALEEALNTRLFERSTRQLTITEAGNAFYREVSAIPDLVRAGHNAIQPFNEEVKGELRVKVPATFAHSMREKVIPNFLAKHPKVKLSIDLMSSIPDHADSDHDIIIMGHLSGTPMPEVNWVAVKLCDVPLGIYATPPYIKKYGAPKTPNDLAQHNCLSSISKKWPFMSKDGYMFHVSVDGCLTSTDDEVIHAATMKHLGIAYSVPYLFMDQLKKKKVVTLLREYTNFYIEVFALYRPNPYLPMKIRRFVDVMKEHYQAMQEEIISRRKL